jgi:hypothetical protein
MTDLLDNLALARPGDILLTHGPWMLSDAIANHNEGFSHASLIVAIDPVILVAESVPPVSKVLRYADLHKDSTRVVLLHDLSLDADQRFLVVNYATKMLGKLYGLDRFIGLGLDTLLDTQWFGDHLRLSRNCPVCTVFVAESRNRIGLNFGVEAEGATPGEITKFSRNHPEIYQWIEQK